MREHKTTRRRALQLFGLAGASLAGGCLGGGEGDSAPTPTRKEEAIENSDVSTKVSIGNALVYSHPNKPREYEFRLESVEEDGSAEIAVEIYLPDEVGQNKEGSDPASAFTRNVRPERGVSIDNYTDFFYGGEVDGKYMLCAGRDYDMEVGMEEEV